MDILQQSSKFKDRYVYDGEDEPQLLGEGGSGTVYKVMQKVDGSPVRQMALKILKYNADSLVTKTYILNEIRTMIDLQEKDPTCVNIVRYFNADSDTVGDIDLICIEMELCNGETLLSAKSEYFNLDFQSKVIEGLVSGLKFIHECGFVHKDLNFRNILFEKGTVKIGDFGFAHGKSINDTQRKHEQNEEVKQLFQNVLKEFNLEINDLPKRKRLKDVVKDLSDGSMSLKQAQSVLHDINVQFGSDYYGSVTALTAENTTSSTFPGIELIFDFLCRKLPPRDITLFEANLLNETQLAETANAHKNPANAYFKIMYSWKCQNPSIDHRIKLREMLSEMQRQDLLNDMDGFEIANYKCSNVIGSNSCLTNNDFTTIASHLANDYLHLVRFLGLPQHSIEQIETDYDTVREQIFQCLVKITRSKPSVTRQNLCDGLVYAKQVGVVGILNDKWRKEMST